MTATASGPGPAPAADGGGAPIADHALIGDTRTAALVASDGTLDWMCLPHFDGEPVFGSLVGGPAAGKFRAGPLRRSPVASRRYRPSTATLETTWTTDQGRLTLTEGMVAELGRYLLPETLVVRRLAAADGPVDVEVDLAPRLGESHRPPVVHHRREGVVLAWGSLALALRSDPVLPPGSGDAATSWRVRVEPGRPLTLVLSTADRQPLVHVDPERAWEALRDDEERWRRWCGHIDTAGIEPRYRAPLERSLLTLRLLTYSPSGAPVAAPTTSLPEDPGGVRNWDYRFAWPRDASIGIGAFLGVGHVDEARHFLAWLLHASRLARPRLPVLLTLHGRYPRPERELRGWPGYRSSRPVRTGNGAADQHQLDGYGWVVDAAWLLTRAGVRLDGETWRAVRGFVDEVARRWREPDAGIWEVRDDAAHHVHSKLMAWLALDRGLRIARRRGVPERRRRGWVAEREAIAAEVRTRGFDAGLGAYVRSYGSTELDAAVLVLPLLGLEPPGSPRTRATIDAIRSRLGAGGPFLYRYPPGSDGLPGGEGAFLPCSFWLVQALAASGRRPEAAELFDELLAWAGPLGLYPEEADPSSGEFLGNHPQALTHAAMVQATLALRDSNRLGGSPPS